MTGGVPVAVQWNGVQQQATPVPVRVFSRARRINTSGQLHSALMFEYSKRFTSHRAVHTEHSTIAVVNDPAYRATAPAVSSRVGMNRWWWL